MLATLYQPHDVLMSSPLFDLVHHTTDSAFQAFVGMGQSARLEMHEDQAGYYVTVAAPGVRSRDLRIDVGHDTLHVAGETKSDRHHAQFDRSVQLPKDADVSSAQTSATHADGMLSIFVPKLTPAGPCKLTIQAAADAPMDAATDKSYHLEIAAPGVRSEDLTITVDNGVLQVHGETKGVQRHAKISRSFRLPRDADVTQASVVQADGLCTIIMPRLRDAEPRQLAIQAAEPSPLKTHAADAPTPLASEESSEGRN